MNWGLIGTIAGILATIYGIKFVYDLFKSLFGKDQRKRMISAMGDKISEANETVAWKIKQTAYERKEAKRQKKMEEDQPMIIIR